MGTHRVSAYVCCVYIHIYTHISTRNNKHGTDLYSVQKVLYSIVICIYTVYICTPIIDGLKENISKNVCNTIYRILLLRRIWRILPLTFPPYSPECYTLKRCVVLRREYTALSCVILLSRLFVVYPSSP